jgi:hypothetical protein
VTLGLWLALGCGGRSIAGEDDSGRQEDGDGRGETRATCEQACEEAATCDRAPYACDFFCGQAQSAADDAGCGRAYAALADCLRQTADPCAATSPCVTEVNAFGVCLLDYCGTHRGWPICSG